MRKEILMLTFHFIFFTGKVLRNRGRRRVNQKNVDLDALDLGITI